MISVIIPIYHGKKYIDGQIAQIEKAASYLRAQDNTAQSDLELIFVNDAPDDPIENEYCSKIIDIIVVNSDMNRGIHGARVYGISFAKGEFVHFLDQDDEISPKFYASQINAIGDADVVYCRGYNGRNEIYNTGRVFETSMLRENILDRPPMISPGQALIRQDSISDFWKEHILKNSGSDDFFLWLCMVSEGRKFVTNQDKLYRHVATGINLSSDIYRSGLSDQEMIDLLIDNGLFKGAEAELVKKIPEKQYKRKNDIQLKAQASLLLISRLLRGEAGGNHLSVKLKSKNAKKVYIYGAGDLGHVIYEVLKMNSFEVEGFMDRNFEYIHAECKVFSPGMLGKMTGDNLVIVALSMGAEEVQKEFAQKYKCNVVTINELLADINETSEWQE